MKRDFILSICLLASLINLIIHLVQLMGDDALQVLFTSQNFWGPVPVVHHVPASTTGANNINSDNNISPTEKRRSNAVEEALGTSSSGLRGGNTVVVDTDRIHGKEKNQEKVKNDGIKQATIRSVEHKKPSEEHDYPRVVFLSSKGTISCEYTKCSESKQPTTTTSTTTKFENEMGEYKGPPSDEDAPPMPTYETTCIQGRAWHSLNHVNCNSFHEIDMGMHSELNDNINYVEYLAHGGRRSAWELNSSYEKIILKMLRPDKAEFDEEFLDNQRMDALAHERLTHSSHVINVYGFCGASTFNEYAGGGNFRDWLSKGVNKNTATDKLLVIARNISMALAEAHGIDAAYPDDNDNSAMPKGMPTLLHQDFRHHNVLMTNEGRVKISDFNAGRLLRWDTAKQSTCGYKWERPCKVLNRQAKAPEECADEKTQHQLSLTSSQDVWQLGTVLRYILDRKRWPFASQDSQLQTFVFYDDETKTPYNSTEAEKRMRKLTLEGYVPRLPEGYSVNSTDPAIRAMVKARDVALRIEPEERASAREIASILDRAVEEISELGSKGATSNGADGDK